MKDLTILVLIDMHILPSLTHCSILLSIVDTRLIETTVMTTLTMDRLSSMPPVLTSFRSKLNLITIMDILICSATS